MGKTLLTTRGEPNGVAVGLVTAEAWFGAYATTSKRSWRDINIDIVRFANSQSPLSVGYVAQVAGSELGGLRGVREEKCRQVWRDFPPTQRVAEPGIQRRSAGSPAG